MQGTDDERQRPRRVWNKISFRCTIIRKQSKVRIKYFLQRPFNDQILTADAMFKFCKTNITAIHFEFVPIIEMVVVRAAQEKRFEEGRT